MSETYIARLHCEYDICHAEKSHYAAGGYFYLSFYLSSCVKNVVMGVCIII